ncbi:MAG: NAD(P)-dependent oxidoreductase [Eubacteriales bacterium]|nr:NAD(P)-dependent oxidoreductase [Eubacteriales bacterium]
MKVDAKTILISGAGGFLGGELIKQLGNNPNYNILALTSNKSKLKMRFKEIKNISYISVNDWNDGTFVWKSVDVLIHCAFTIKSDNELLATSLEFTKKIFEDAKKHKVSSVINMSSKSVYGTKSKPLWMESLQVSPENSYALAKYASEIIADTVLRDSDTRYTSIRLASLIGPGFDMRAISKLIKSALENKTIKIVGGKQTFEFLDIRDAAGALISLISSSQEKWCPIYNLGNSERKTIIEIANIVSCLASDYVDAPILIELEEKNTELDIGMDSSLFYDATGWKAQYTMRDTLDSIFKYYVAKKMKDGNLDE